MVDTNQLLSIAFTIISSFTNVVHIPPDRVPQDRADLQKIVIGSPHSPLDLWLVHKRGDEFWICDGVVQQYQSPDSYFHLQNNAARSRLMGAQTISSNQVIEMATNILQRLAKTGNPVAMVKPTVKGTRYKELPFFLINWPNTNLMNYGGLATVEIDACKGRAVYVQVWTKEYYDLTLAQEISNRVYTPESPQFPREAYRLTSDVLQGKPTTNLIQTLIPKWLNFCEKLDLNPGAQTSVADVDWEATFKSVSPPSLPAGTLYKIQFRNGAAFNCINETVFAHACSDASFIGAWAEKSPDYWKAFVGTPSNTWETLAARLNMRLVEKLGVSNAYLKRFTPTPYTLGDGGVSRCVVRWYETKSIGKMPQDSIKTALSAEFDLATGQIKNLMFDDWELLKWNTSPKPKK